MKKEKGEIDALAYGVNGKVAGSSQSRTKILPVVEGTK